MPTIPLNARPGAFIAMDRRDVAEEIQDGLNDLIARLQDAGMPFVINIGYTHITGPGEGHESMWAMSAANINKHASDEMVVAALMTGDIREEFLKTTRAGILTSFRKSVLLLDEIREALTNEPDL